MEPGYVALGLVQGALAACNALGLVLLWRTTRVVNLAQPAMGLVGGVLTGMLVAATGWSFWWAAPVGIATGALLGFAAERLVMVRLADLPRAVPMVATIGLATLFGALQSGIPFVLGGRLPSYTVDLGTELFVFPVLLRGPHLLALLALPVALAGLWWFVHRSRLGTAAVAVGQDHERAMTLGVDTGLVRAVAWAVAGALSGIAGVLSIPVLGFSLGDGVAPTVLLLALAPAVLAGLRSLPMTVVWSLVVGVGYQLALVLAPRAGWADVVLAVAILGGIAAQRRRLGRAMAADRAGSWAAGTSPRPLPRVVRDHPRWRRLTAVVAVAAVVAAALPPLWLVPAADVRWATGAALALAAVAVAVAWTYAGEVVLGHWGLAGLAAAIAFALPGPLLLRGAAGIAVATLLGVGLALVGRRRGGLAAAVAGLAIAVVAPVALLALGPAQLADAGWLRAATPSLAVAAAIGLVRLRSHRLGTRMVAARDEPGRARDLDIDPARSRAVALGLSGALAGLAGVCYLASVPAGLAPGAFDPARSLEVLAFAVVGGLGAPLSAGLGAALLVLAGTVMPSPWDALATGAGVLWVVLFLPAGLGRVVTAVRDLTARLVTGVDVRAAHEEPGAGAVPAAPSDAPPEEPEPLVAGADTREALGTPTVRAAVVAAGLLAAPALAALVGSPLVLRDHFGIDAGASAPWVVVVLAAAAAVLAVVARRRPVDPFGPVVTAETATVVGGLLAAGTFLLLGDLLLLAVVVLATPLVAGWVLARLARAVRFAVVAEVRAAAVGVVVAGAVLGGLGGLHLAVVAGGNDLAAAAGWGAVYALGGTVALVAAHRGLAGDTRRTVLREAAATGTNRRRHWMPLRLDSVTVDFGATCVLDGVDLEVDTGELVALVGGNGSGKSTLLRTAAGLLAPTAGRIDVAGTDVSALRADERAAAGVALVSGARPAFADLTVHENLRVGAYLTHRTRSAFEAATAHVLRLVPVLADRLDTRAGLLSGGERRQLAVAQTLYRRPSVLLVDELTLGLDTAARTATLRLLRTLADDGIGVVVVDHDLASLTGVCDRVVVLHAGRTHELDDPARLDEVRGDLLPATFLSGATA